MLRVGIVGLDSSHAISLAAFCLANPDCGAAVTVAWPGGSTDAPLSIGRVEGFTASMRNEIGAAIVDTPEEVAEHCDAVAILAMDGRTHAPLFSRIAPFRKPVFITKPLAASRLEAGAIARDASCYETRWFSASALRFCRPVSPARTDVEIEIPLWFEEANAGWLWYGIHGVELALATIGPGVFSVRVAIETHHETLYLRFRDGRIATIVGRFDRAAPYRVTFNGAPPRTIAVSMEPLERRMIDFFRGAPSPVPLVDMMESMACLDAANASRAAGGMELFP